MIRTSRSHPLRIDEVAIDGMDGRIGITFCPGKIQKSALSGPWERDLNADINVIKAWGATTWVNLLTRKEMVRLGIGDLEKVLGESGASIRYFHLPIEDTCIPDAEFERRWTNEGMEIRYDLLNGGKLLVHCKGGLGRSGTIAARLLVEMGQDPDVAIGRVRQARPGAIENDLQESHVRSIKSVATIHPIYGACRRLLEMVRVLHTRGYELLRIDPGMSPSGCHWRCELMPAAMTVTGKRSRNAAGRVEPARYTSGMGTSYFDWKDSRYDSPEELAVKFTERFGALAEACRGKDPAYVSWYYQMLGDTAPDGILYAYAEYMELKDFIPVQNKPDMKIPLPPAPLPIPGQKSKRSRAKNV